MHISKPVLLFITPIRTSSYKLQSRNWAWVGAVWLVRKCCTVCVVVALYSNTTDLYSNCNRGWKAEFRLPYWVRHHPPVCQHHSWKKKKHLLKLFNKYGLCWHLRLKLTVSTLILKSLLDTLPLALFLMNSWIVYFSLPLIITILSQVTLIRYKLSILLTL